VQPKSLLRRLCKLTAAELRLLIEAQVALLACQVARWHRPIGKLVSATPEGGTSPASAKDLGEAPAIGWAVTRAARYGFFRPQCLVRSLAVQRMLRRRGASVGELRIGVRREGGGLVAHAWVELDGVVIADSPEHIRTFTPASDFRLEAL
jgi:hypothetical protein